MRSAPQGSALRGLKVVWVSLDSRQARLAVYYHTQPAGLACILVSIERDLARCLQRFVVYVRRCPDALLGQASFYTFQSAT